MNLFSRAGRVLRSYANAVLSAAEDPEKILDQALIDMQGDLVKMRQQSAQAMASTKQLEKRYKAAAENSAEWYKRAQLALEKGDEELAREALKRRKGYEESAQGLKGQLDSSKAQVQKLLEASRTVEAKVVEAKAKKDTLKARAQSAKATKKVNDMVSGIDPTSSLAAFEKMEEKVMALESETEAVAELAGDTLSSRFAALEAGDDVEGDLDDLRRSIEGPKVAGELPQRSVSEALGSSAASSADPALDEELERLRRDSQS